MGDNGRNVLLANRSLTCFSGSELVTLDLAREFSRRRWNVYLASFDFSEEMRKLYNGIASGWINLNEPSYVNSLHFDLMFGHHFTTFDKILVEYGVMPDMVSYSSLSPYEPLEFPPVYANCLTAVFANSGETSAQLIRHGVDAKRISIFENCVPDEFFDFPKVELQALRRIAVISNHVPAELADAAKLFPREVSVNFFGVEYTSVLVTSELLCEYDLVVTIGRTVQMCFALGIPVYCYDRFGGPGYLNETNFDRAAFFNFSGRCCQIKLDARSLVYDVLHGFSKALGLLQYLKDVTSERYRLSVSFESALAFIEQGDTYYGVDNKLRKKLARKGVDKEQPRNVISFELPVDFDPVVYLTLNPDVKRAGIEPVWHYLNHGCHENRAYKLMGEKSCLNRKYAVVIHLYYVEMWGEILSRIENIHYLVDVFITAPIEHKDTIGALDLKGAKIFFFENLGRDVLPFLKLLKMGVLDSYEYVCKIHTKKSPHLVDGDVWRERLFDGLLGGAETFKRIISAFENYVDIGLIAPSGALLDVRLVLMSNQRWLEKLSGDFLIDWNSYHYLFPVGTMFWFRSEALKGLSVISDYPFENESGQLDGCLHHAIERFLPLVALKNGYRTVDVDDLEMSNPEPILIHGTKVYQNWLNGKSEAYQSLKFTVNNMTGGGCSECLESAPKRHREVMSQVVFLFFIDATHAASDSLKNTLGSFYDQKYHELKVIIVSSDAVFRDINHENILWVSDGEQFDVIRKEVETCGDRSWVCHVRAGDRIGDYPLELLAKYLHESTSIGLVYPDEDAIDPLYGPSTPIFRPDFNLDYLRSYPYIGQFLLMRGREYLDLGGLDRSFGSACFYDYALRYYERYGESGITHIPEVLFHAAPLQFENDVLEQHSQALQTHLQRCHVAAKLEPGLLLGSFHVRYLHENQPLVSIIIPTKNQLPILQRCLESLLERTGYKRYEILLIDNQSTDADAVRYLQGLVDLNLPNLRVLSYPHAFNFADMNNLAVQEARGEYLVLLNNDTAIVKPDWLDALLNHAQRPEVGIAGAKLLYPDGKVQHGGVILGLNGPADHPFVGEAIDAPGYCGRLLVDQQYSAVTAACMMIRKSVYEAVGGMDADVFKVSYNDVDLCLKVRDAGFRIIWTPYSVVMHEASVSQKQVDTATQEAKRQRFESEQLAMYRKWMPALISDPAYNPNLSLIGSGFKLETDTLFSSCSGMFLPKVLAHNADPYGSGSYRVIQPLQAMLASDMATGVCREHFLDPVHVAKAALDVIVLQRQTTDAQLRCIGHYREFSNAKLIYELDDYLPNLPVSSVHKGGLPKDVLRRLRQATALCDRVTVSTSALKDALQDLHVDMVILPNYLPIEWWGGMVLRSESIARKPRVGWAGGVGHAGDLRVIADVIKALSDRVDWVFLGMMPKGLEPYIAESHPSVPIEEYPKRLAAMDLDLALAPLENNLFNECKSNLRLLEYGICGYPVIATDIEPYRCGLPVTLVKNRFKDWVAAIEEKVADRQALWVEGAALQAAVREGWMLDGINLMRWRDGWMLGGG